MYARHRVSRAAIDLLKRFEGYRQTAAQLPDGRWTIGHGHTLTAREGVQVSVSDAEALLLYDLITVAHVVNENAFAPLNQNQFDALCSFAFNIGVDNLNWYFINIFIFFRIYVNYYFFNIFKNVQNNFDIF